MQILFHEIITILINFKNCFMVTTSKIKYFNLIFALRKSKVEVFIVSIFNKIYHINLGIFLKHMGANNFPYFQISLFCKLPIHMSVLAFLINL